MKKNCSPSGFPLKPSSDQHPCLKNNKYYVKFGYRFKQLKRNNRLFSR